MRSITEQGALDEFLSTAELAGTDFTAEKLPSTMKIIHSDQYNPYLLSAREEASTLRKHRANIARLRVPRRPQWDESTTPQELDSKEKESLIEWRRGLAEMQEGQDLLMTPFERNLEVWRQLWRVIERSDLVVQIVDARNPLLFRCVDLEGYVREVGEKEERLKEGQRTRGRGKRNLLLVNKADMMTLNQRRMWAEYFEKEGVEYRFFSAHLARELYETAAMEEDLNGEHDYTGNGSNKRESPDGQKDLNGTAADDNGESFSLPSQENTLAKEGEKVEIQDEAKEEAKWVAEENLEGEDEKIKILTVEELEQLFLENAPDMENEDAETPRKTTIGLVGYPNVGKSSTINALIGAKKVSVSATPGKTKHFQTIHLSPEVILCDCPGLVFPNFATTKAELVCNGILPIDQMREYIGPAGLVAQRIPQAYFEALYGVKIPTLPLEEGGIGVPTGSEILSAYARARGFATTGQGQPDESRAARIVLKDYVNGKLLFCHPPPSDPPIDPHEFNRELYDFDHLPQKRRAMLAAQIETSLNDSNDASLMDHSELIPPPALQGPKSNRLDERFFRPRRGGSGHLSMPFNHKYTEQGRIALASGKQVSGRKQKTMIALEKGIDPSEVQLNGKKHFKGARRKARNEPKEQEE